MAERSGRMLKPDRLPGNYFPCFHRVGRIETNWVQQPKPLACRSARRLFARAFLRDANWPRCHGRQLTAERPALIALPHGPENSFDAKANPVASGFGHTWHGTRELTLHTDPRRGLVSMQTSIPLK